MKYCGKLEGNAKSCAGENLPVISQMNIYESLKQYFKITYMVFKLRIWFLFWREIKTVVSFYEKTSDTKVNNQLNWTVGAG